MQIIENKNLYANEQKTKLIMFDILDKLWIIHNCGFIHGDIKPSNIVKREFNDNLQYIIDGWKLIDFDRMRKYNTKGKYVGTPGYSAPEMNFFLWFSYFIQFIWGTTIEYNL
eukprot:292283_1